MYHCVQQKLTFVWLGVGEDVCYSHRRQLEDSFRGQQSPPTFWILGIKLILRHGGRCLCSLTHRGHPKTNQPLATIALDSQDPQLTCSSPHSNKGILEDS